MAYHSQERLGFKSDSKTPQQDEAAEPTSFLRRLHGCAYGLEYKQIPILKSWTVLTSNRALWMSLQKKCPGHSDHAECRGPAAQASPYYPPKMIIAGSWQASEEMYGTSITQDIEKYLLLLHPEEDEDRQGRICQEVREQSPELFALTRNNFPKEAPTGRKLELVKQLMRIHRSSGHSSFGNLQRLLRARKAPEWAVTLAGNMQCPDCIESRKPLLHPPASTKDTPELFEVVGVDVFEYDSGEGKQKDKFLLWRDRASGYVMTDHLSCYKGRWEPTAQDVVRSFVKWLMHNPAPKWILSDAGPQFTAEHFLDFCSRSGIGVLTAPAEAHWILGAEEGCIKILKASVGKLIKEEPTLSVAHAFALAAHGANNTIGPSGFSAFQWLRGAATPQDPLPSGLDPKQAFGGLLRLKEKARIACEQEHAKYKLSRLNNALGRSPQSFSIGALVTLWRQRIKPGKTSGNWTGPVRVLLQEGSTLEWLAHGATLIRAKTNQCRECTRREELQATLDGVAIYRQPVTMDSLLKSFTGKRYTNVTGESPSKEQMMKDLAPTDVRLLHDPGKKEQQEAKRPKGPPEGKTMKVPVKKTIQKRGSKQDEMKPQEEHQSREEQPDEPQEPEEKKTTSAQAAMTPRTQALESEGKPIPPTPFLPHQPDDDPAATAPQSSSGNCSTPQCKLPGGHHGPHEDDVGRKFAMSTSGGRINLDDDPSQRDEGPSSSSSSSSTSSSEELRTEVEERRRKAKEPRRSRGNKRKADEGPEEGQFYALEIEVTEEESSYLMKHPRKAGIFLSKKMQEKGKERGENWTSSRRRTSILRRPRRRPMSCSQRPCDRSPSKNGRALTRRK